MTDEMYQLGKFEKSIRRLEEALAHDIEEDDLFLDGIIQRFEFTFESAWKSIKMVLRYSGEDCISPRDCIKSAYKHGWIEDEETFLELLRCRNLTSHTYSFEIAYKVYETIRKNYKAFIRLFDNLKKILNE